MILYAQMEKWLAKMISEGVPRIFSEVFMSHIVIMMPDITLPRSAQYCFMKPFQVIKRWHVHLRNLQSVKKCSDWGQPKSLQVLLWVSLGPAFYDVQIPWGLLVLPHVRLRQVSILCWNLFLRDSHPLKHLETIGIGPGSSLTLNTLGIILAGSQGFLQMFDHAPELVIEKFHIFFFPVDFSFWKQSVKSHAFKLWKLTKKPSPFSQRQDRSWGIYQDWAKFASLLIEPRFRFPRNGGFLK